MHAQNLISLYQGARAIEKSKISDKSLKFMKNCEIDTLNSFCDIIIKNGCHIDDLDGFYCGYLIERINKEFDLLRFCDDTIINIELKSQFTTREKILHQMKMNYYYLKFLKRDIKIFTYVQNHGFYKYITKSDDMLSIDVSEVLECLQNNIVNFNIDPEKEFIPSNYLISPFNCTKDFINNEYFLTKDQNKTKEEINKVLYNNKFMYFTISADAGTGKTLLMYDIAKELYNKNLNPIIIHCGKLNSGQNLLNKTYNWKIRSISNVKESEIDSVIEGSSVIFIDEAQRININQLEIIINKSIKDKIPIIFSYDTKQFLRDGEKLDVSEYLNSNHLDIDLLSKTLTNKIRTNKEMASFINNLLHIGKSKDNLNYESVTIEYYDNYSREFYDYMLYLKGNSWIPIKYTTYINYKKLPGNSDPYRYCDFISNLNAHDVIGQEFSNVVLVVDENFQYNDLNNLVATSSRYNAIGMLYQIVTRVVNKLKIVVVNNPDLYIKLLQIKNMGKI